MFRVSNATSPLVFVWEARALLTVYGGGLLRNSIDICFTSDFMAFCLLCRQSPAYPQGILRD